jgi:toxin secretion/phage lysis holin
MVKFNLAFVVVGTYAYLGNLVTIAEKNPLFSALVGLMFLDIASGVSVAWQRREVSSKLSREGMMKKVQVLLLCGGAALFEWLMLRTTGQAFAIAGITMFCFCVNEFISLLENGKRGGIPIPEVLTRGIADVKSKLPFGGATSSEDKDAKDEGKKEVKPDGGNDNATA